MADMKKGVDYIAVGCGCLIVNDRHQILLIKRTDKSQGGAGEAIWSQPGGAIEFGEAIEDAIKREIKEELNVDIELFGPGLYAENITTKDGITKHRFTGSRFAKIIGGELKIMEPEKHEAVEWFDLDKLPEQITIYTLPNIQAYKAWINQMQHFSDKLMKFPKWNDKIFTKDLLLKHLDEVKELIANDDSHQYAEIEDLINIAEVRQKQHLSSAEIEELIAKRFGKFMDKIHLD